MCGGAAAPAGDPSPAHLFHTAVFSALGDAQPAGADPPPPLLPLLRPEAAVLPKRLGKEQQKGKAKMAPQAPLVMPVMQSMEAQPLPFELRVLELCLHEVRKSAHAWAVSAGAVPQSGEDECMHPRLKKHACTTAHAHT